MINLSLNLNDMKREPRKLDSIGARASIELKQQLDNFCAKNGISPSKLIIKLITEFLNQNK